MSITVQEISYNARALIDEYNEDGVVIPASEVATIETNSIRFINMAQQEVYKLLKIFKTFEFFNKPAPNLLGNLSNFELITFIGDDQNYPEGGVEGAKAYYFEVDDDAIVYIEEFNGSTWDILITETVTGITQPTAYKGLITPTVSTYPIRIRFSGTTVYNHINRCLFSYPFKADGVPDYTPWVKQDMPNDFGELHKIIGEYPYQQYVVQANYKWEGFDDLYFKYDYEGSLRIVYVPIPDQVTELTDTLVINDPIAIQFINFYVAAKVATAENQKLVQFYEDKSNELKFMAEKTKPNGEEKIMDVYNGNSRHDYTDGYFGGGGYYG